MKTAIFDTVKDAPARALDSVTGYWGRTRTFLTEVRNELKRVSWPSRKEVYATTFVVILTSIFFGLYLYVIDLGVKAIVEMILRLAGAV